MHSLVPRPNPQEGKGLGTLVMVLQLQQSCTYLNRLVLEHMQSRARDGVQDQQNFSMSPDPFLLRVGSGNDTTKCRMLN